MTILHLSTGLNVGGAEMMLLKLLSRMDASRFRNVVVSLIDVGEVGRRIKDLGVPVHSLGMRRGRPTLFAMIRLVRILRAERPSVVQSWMYHADLLALVAGKIARVPRVVWNLRCSDIVQHDPSRMTTWTIAASAKLSAYPDAVIVNSEAGRIFHLARGYRPRRWEMIPNGFDLQRFAPSSAARDSIRKELGLPPEAILIGLLARYHPMKDHDSFLRAAISLRKSHPTVHFVLAGRDVLTGNRELTKVLAGEGQDNFHFLGERKDVHDLMASLDILTSSSAYGEGFSNSIGEAMACGIPCVVTDVGDSRLILGDGGEVIPPRQPAALESAWTKILGMDAHERRELGEKGRARMNLEYSLDRITQKYENLYANL